VAAAEGRSPWLIDTPALERLHRSAIPDEWANRIDRGLVHVTTVTPLAAGCPARPAQDLVRIPIAAIAGRSGLTILHLGEDCQRQP
jgi:hypothetical protein